MNTNQQLQKPKTNPETGVEFIPFGAQDKVKLSIDIVKKLVAVKTKSGATCSDADAVKFIAMCQARRLNPFEGDAFLIGYDGKDGPTFSLITAHQAFLKRAEVNPEYDGMKSGIIVERDGNLVELEGDFYLQGDTLLGGWATVFFKKRTVPMSKRVRLQRFQKAWGIWQEDPAGMICKCAEADALRSSFPTMLGGMYLKEEVLETDKTTSFATPMFTDKGGEPTVEAPPPQHEQHVPEPGNAPSADATQVPLKQIRALCKSSKVKESALIEYLESSGSIEDCATLEEIALSEKYQSVLPLIVERWDEIVTKLKPGKE